VNPTAGLLPEDHFHTYVDNGVNTFNPEFYQDADYIFPPGMEERLVDPIPPVPEDTDSNEAGANQRRGTTAEDGSSEQDGAPGRGLSEEGDELQINRDEFVQAVRRFKAEQQRQVSEEDARHREVAEVFGEAGPYFPGHVMPLTAASANDRRANDSYASLTRQQLTLGARVGGPLHQQRAGLSSGAQYDSGSESAGNRSRASSASRSSVRTGVGSRSTVGYNSSITTVASRRQHGQASVKVGARAGAGAVAASGTFGTAVRLNANIAVVPLGSKTGSFRPGPGTGSRAAVSPLASRTRKAAGSPAAYRTGPRVQLQYSAK
jgi:hypothetical protein